MCEAVCVRARYYARHEPGNQVRYLAGAAWDDLPDIREFTPDRDLFMLNVSTYLEQHDRIEISAKHNGVLVGGLCFTWGVDAHAGPAAWPLFTYVAQGWRGRVGLLLQREYIRQVHRGNLPAYITTARLGPGLYQHRIRRTHGRSSESH